MKYLILILLLSSCYGERKARQQSARAALTFPGIIAKMCADLYPVRETILKGDTVVVMDTIYEAGTQIFDTVTVKDTVRITKTVTLPAKVITKTITVLDTIVKESTARLDDCEIERKKVVALLTKAEAEVDKYKGRSKTRLWMLLALLLALGGSLYFNFKPK